MTASSDVTRSFTYSNEAWYAKVPGNADLYENDEVMISVEAPDVQGEFAVRWKPLNGSNVPQLQMFDDSWGLIPHIQDLLGALSQLHDKNVAPKELCDLLKSLQFSDETAVEPPTHLKLLLDSVAKQGPATRKAPSP